MTRFLNVKGSKRFLFKFFVKINSSLLSRWSVNLTLKIMMAGALLPCANKNWPPYQSCGGEITGSRIVDYTNYWPCLSSFITVIFSFMISPLFFTEWNMHLTGGYHHWFCGGQELNSNAPLSSRYLKISRNGLQWCQLNIPKNSIW